MIHLSEPYIYFCLANFLLIVTGLFCAIIRQFHVCESYKGHADYYHPARKLLILFFLSHILEIPYLIYCPSNTALLYVSTKSLIVVPIFLKIIWERYYLLMKQSKLYVWLHLLIPIIYILPLMYMTFMNIQINAKLIKMFIYFTTPIFILIVFSLIWMQFKIYKTCRRNYLEKNSTPFKFLQAKLILQIALLPHIICIVFYISFWIQSAVFKMYLDIACCFMEIPMLLYILSNHRKIRNQMIDHPHDDNEDNAESTYEEQQSDEIVTDDSQCRLLSKEQCNTLINDIVSIIVNKELYKNSNLSLSDLCSLLGSNRTYVSEAISLSKYGSFYRMINHFRIKYAMELMQNDPQMKIDDVAISSGFSSRFTFTRAFKEFNQTTPSNWKKA